MKLIQGRDRTKTYTLVPTRMPRYKTKTRMDSRETMDYPSAYTANEANKCPETPKKEKKKIYGSGGIRTHASGETGALIQRLRPLGHATKHTTSDLDFPQYAGFKLLQQLHRKAGQHPTVSSPGKIGAVMSGSTQQLSWVSYEIVTKNQVQNENINLNCYSAR